MFDDLAIARALHVAAVVHWIGGVLFVTFVLLPAVARMAGPTTRIALFDAVERRFALAARVSTVVAGASGFYLTHTMDLWGRFLDPRFWWMHGMVAMWAVFTLMLFVAEPLVLHAWFEARAARDPDGTFRLVTRLHRVLSTVAVVVILGATAGAHGYLPF